MRVVFLGATQRGVRFFARMLELRPDLDYTVFSFREETWEPPFLDDLRALTERHGGQFFEARQVGEERWREFWEHTPIDLMLLVSWRYLVPARIFHRPTRGTFVFHDSLLPAYRGFAPTVWAILNGEPQTGVTLFEIADGFDEGDIVAQARVPIESVEYVDAVMERVTQTYLDVLEQNYNALLDGTAPRRPQDHTRATYTAKRLPEDNQIDWRESTRTIFNLIRAVSEPYPGAFTFLNGRRLTIWRAQCLENFPPYIGRVPGRVVEVLPKRGSVVLTGDGALLVTRAQFQNQRIQNADEILKQISMTLCNV